jgi:hypothetical protein
MVARVKPDPGALVVVFERDGDPPVRVEVPDGHKALIRALILLLTYPKLQAGDRLLVESADDPNT